MKNIEFNSQTAVAIGRLIVTILASIAATLGSVSYTHLDVYKRQLGIGIGNNTRLATAAAQDLAKKTSKSTADGLNKHKNLPVSAMGAIGKLVQKSIDWLPPALQPVSYTHLRQRFSQFLKGLSLLLIHARRASSQAKSHLALSMKASSNHLALSR